MNEGNINKAKILFKYLLRQCEKLPPGPQKHYKFQIKQVVITFT